MYAKYTFSYKQESYPIHHKSCCKNVLTGGKDIMDTYEITNPAKFFAVATETFFERPKQMKRTYSELYRELES